jgi:AcrR family transcriptional regulator
VEEIIDTARRLLVADGVDAVTLRAISREMGMTAPALYRYYDSLDALLSALCIALYDECTAHLKACVADLPPGDLVSRLATLARAFRSWCVGHPAEFALMFASPGKRHVDDQVLRAAGDRFAEVFISMFVELWHRSRFPVTPADQMPPALLAQFEGFLKATGLPLPPGAVQIFTSCWIRLYGLVALEIFGHLYHTLDDNAAPMFEAELAAVADQLGLPRPAPPD